MPTIDFLLQGLDETDDHFAALNQLLDLPDINRCLISVAFMNSTGAGMVVDKLSQYSECLHLYVGIRNGITSKQSINLLRSRGIFPCCVDTATQAFIFHPKVYFAQSTCSAVLITGSANFTLGGLVKNVEASVIAHLDLSLPNDAAIVTKVIEDFEILKDRHPENVFLLDDSINLDEMVQQGLLVDETAQIQRANTRATSGQGRTELRPRMNLNVRRLGAARRSRAQSTENVGIPLTAATITAFSNNQLLWKSGQLNRRDLNIPTGTSTHATGSMLLKVGDPSQDIDQRHFFRDVVFSSADWQADTDPSSAHMERCIVKFRVIIKDIDYGVHELKLSHNTRTDTATYLQNNSMTQIHWGETVKPMIAQEDLLGSILCIYAPDDEAEFYTLTFDVE